MVFLILTDFILLFWSLFQVFFVKLVQNCFPFLVSTLRCFSMYPYTGCQTLWINMNTCTKNEDTTETSPVNIQYGVLQQYVLPWPWRTDYNLWEWNSWCYIIFRLFKFIFFHLMGFYSWHWILHNIHYLEKKNIFNIVKKTRILLPEKDVRRLGQTAIFCPHKQ